SGVLGWTPAPSDVGLHPIQVQASDPDQASDEQAYDLRVVQDFCAIYPIALPTTALTGIAPGTLIKQLPRGTGPGNFSWLTWTGANDAPTLATSLVPPGDSWRYMNPDNAIDRVLNIADFAQGAPGSMNASA